MNILNLPFFLCVTKQKTFDLSLIRKHYQNLSILSILNIMNAQYSPCARPNIGTKLVNRSLYDFWVGWYLKCPKTVDGLLEHFAK